jgi:hypothetical protein
MTSTLSTVNGTSVSESSILFPGEHQEEEEEVVKPRPMSTGTERLAILFAVVFSIAAVAFVLLMIIEIAGNSYAAVHHCQSWTLACSVIKSCTPLAANGTRLLHDCPGSGILVLEFILGALVALPFVCAASA